MSDRVASSDASAARDGGAQPDGGAPAGSGAPPGGPTPPSWDWPDGLLETPDDGLSASEVRRRREVGLGNTQPPPTTRSYTHNTYLNGSLDEIVGTTQKVLHRSGYTDEALHSTDPDAMPAAVEGT